MGPPGVLDEVYALFSWNPPRLVSDPLRRRSTSSRQPEFYDKHVSDKLVLKRVERLSPLIQDLADNVDKALSVASPTLPTLSPAFTTSERRECEMGAEDLLMSDEKGVADFYNKTTARYCQCLASTLALHPTASNSRWSSLLFWTQSASSSGYAFIDGELRFIRDGGVKEEIKLHRAGILDTMEGSIRRIFEEMRDSKSCLATWKIKSLDAGGELMSAVRNLGTFSWNYCTVKHCRRDPKHEEERKSVADVAIGPDAQEPPWRLPSAAVTSPTLPPPPPSSLEYGPLFSLSPLSALSSEDEEPSPTNKGKKRRINDDDDEEEEAYQDLHDVTAQNLVQQAWAQATRVDGTVIVLHSGNHELVCVRHRASQTLYVSEVVEPHKCVEPGYGKLHVGISVDAIQDAMDRKQQQQPPGDDNGLIGLDKD